MAGMDGSDSSVLKRFCEIAIFHRLFALFAEGFQASLEFIFKE